MLWDLLSLFVYFISQCLHPAIPTFGIHLLEIFLILSFEKIHLYCGSYLCSLSASNKVTSCIWTFLASSFTHPSLHIFDFWVKSILVYTLFQLVSIENYVVLPMHLMHHTIAHAPTNDIQQPVHSAPAVLLLKRCIW